MEAVAERAQRIGAIESFAIGTMIGGTAFPASITSCALPIVSARAPPRD